MLLILQLWLVIAAFLAAAGWILSFFHCLNRFGYLVVFVFLAAISFWWSKERKRPAKRSFLRAFRRRFRKAAPFSYFILAITAIAGGVAHYPTHFGAYSYGIPRVLHWLAEGHWHWVRTVDVRVNVVAANYEWLITPIIAFTKTERLLFLINSFSFLLLPGALFCLFHRLGMRKRTAWWWMWIIPAGYCYCMQAGGLGTDAYVAIFSVGSIALALRARETGNLKDLWASLLGIAFVTGAKQSNLALVLPWLIAAFPALKNLLRRPILSTVVTMVALLASVVPITLGNLLHDTHWAGFGKGHDGAPENAFWGIIGNSFWITFGNLLPPIFPWAEKWNAGLQSFLQTDFGRPFRSFESFGHAPRAAAELYSGVGMTVFGLILISWIFGRRPSRVKTPRNSSKWVRWAAWAALLIFMTKVGINQNIRYLAPYYPLLVPSLLLSAGQFRLVKTRWWQWLAIMTIFVSTGLLIISRQRPLVPVKAIVTVLRNRVPDHFLQRAVNSFTFIEQLRYDLSPLLNLIPSSERVIGYGVRLGDKEPALWKPLWSRKVVRISPNDTPETIRSLQLRYVFLDASMWLLPDGLMDQTVPSKKWTLEEWLRTFDAELLGSLHFRPLPDAPTEPLHLVRLRQKG